MYGRGDLRSVSTAIHIVPGTGRKIRDEYEHIFRSTYTIEAEGYDWKKNLDQVILTDEVNQMKEIVKYYI